MGKQVVLYVVSTLTRSGPTTQLHNIIKYLDQEEFEPHLVTLSPEPEDSLLALYEELDVSLYQLNLSRLGGIFKAKKQLEKIIEELSPNIVHTQGIRADSLLSKININGSWLMTSRNYPYDDYPMKFGRLKGGGMARAHISAMRKCSNVIACSKTIANALKPHGIEATAIQNGVNLGGSVHKEAFEMKQLEHPIFITVGSLIHRKNVSYIISAFNLYAERNKGSLVILGDGPEMSMLKTLAQGPRVYLNGNVSNVKDYLKASDYFISASLSEGLPNTVLEALAAGLPVLLSDIPSHHEIAQETSLSCQLFNLGNGEETLVELLSSIDDIFPPEAREEAEKLASDVFSAVNMSKNYQGKYKKILP